MADEFDSRMRELKEAGGFLLRHVSCGIEVPPGWFGLVKELLENMNKLASGLPKDDDYPIVEQIKEKFGGLRVYIMVTQLSDDPEGALLPDQLADLVDHYEQLSYKICDVCGKPGYLREGGWLATRCDEHA